MRKLHSEVAKWDVMNRVLFILIQRIEANRRELVVKLPGRLSPSQKER